jgi:hypothetical protein
MHAEISRYAIVHTNVCDTVGFAYGRTLHERVHDQQSAGMGAPASHHLGNDHESPD